MLRHEENPETRSQSAAQKRVTPAELASALARLEAKQEGEADGTVSIGEAVSELGLAATPEAVWAEVEAVRAQQAEADWRKRRNIGLPILLASMVLGGFIGLRITRTDPPEGQSPPAAAVALPAPPAMPKPISLDPNMIVADASNKLVRLSEVGDNQPVECNYNDGSFQPSDGDLTFWTLIKHNGQVYVRGWIPRMSDQVFQKNGADVHHWESQFANTDPSDTRHVRLTLPLNGFQVVASGSDGQEFRAVNIHLDKYAHEKWQP